MSQNKTLETLCPKSILTIRVDPSSVHEVILPEEEACIREVVERPRLEFVAGCVCARRLLKNFGWSDWPLVIGQNRVPIWLPGIIGSISHTDGFCGVAVATTADFCSIGLDIERVGRIERRLWKQIAN
jgi:4'-phosphopantetheinyl transferase EntD